MEYSVPNLAKNGKSRSGAAQIAIGRPNKGHFELIPRDRGPENRVNGRKIPR
jgi:hypothetical protein